MDHTKPEDDIMKHAVQIAGRWIGPGRPVFIVAEIGINHNGDIRNALRLIEIAARSGCDAVKFQKRDPESCVPVEQRDKMRETPWGYISYLEYRRRVEFGFDEYSAIDEKCRELGLLWFASCWDTQSVEFMETLNPPCYKIHSAAVTDPVLLERLHRTGRSLILSTGMSTLDQIRTAVAIVGTERLVICHTTSTYPCPPCELNLRMIRTLQREFGCPVGYSGHETGLVPTVAAVALGAVLVERHITLDRAMWGSDHAASIEPGGLEKLVKYIRIMEQALGDGVKYVYESEFPVMQRLRKSVPPVVDTKLSNHAEDPLQILDDLEILHSETPV
jgi:N-acetylneuraminate synthase